MKIKVKYVPSTYTEAYFEEDLNGELYLAGWMQ